MARLTKRTVDAAAVGNRDRFLWDDDLPGFRLRVYPSDAKVYLFQWKREDRTRRLALGRHEPTTCEEARRAALAEVQRGGDPAEDRDRRRRDLTVGGLCDLWLAAGCPRAKPGRDGSAFLKAGSAATYRSAIDRHVRPLLGRRKLGSLRPADLARFQADVAAGRTAVVERTGPHGLARVAGGCGVAGRCAAYLAAVLTWGTKQGLLAANPAAGFEVIPAGERRGSLSVAELGRLGAAMAEPRARRPVRVRRRPVGDAGGGRTRVSAAASIAEAQRFLANGYPPVPILRHDAPAAIERDGRTIRQTPGKQPHGIWARKEKVYGAMPATVGAWARLKDIADYPGLGLACGRVTGVDLDVYEPWLADMIEALAVEMLGVTPLRRVGQAPKRLLVYRVEGDPLPKTQTPELLKGDLKAKVEALGQGQQFVAHGIHPVTRLPFAWGDATPATMPLAELPAVTREQVVAFVAECERRLRGAGYRTRAEIEAEAAPRDPLPRPAAGGGHPNGKAPEAARRPNGHDHDDGPSPFRPINDEAMRRLDSWVRDLFPTAKRQTTGSWRVSSHDLGRGLEEDLSIAPTGIVDFGVADQGDQREGRRTPIDLVIEHGGAADAKQAAQWLADKLGMELRIGRKAERGGPGTRSASAIGESASPAEGGDGPGDALLDLSHDGPALALGEEWADLARHVALWGRWLFWDGSRREPDERPLHMTRGRAYLRRRADELVRAAKAGRIEALDADKAEAVAKGLRSAQTVANVVGLARSNDGQAAGVGQWDGDPWLLGTPGGTIDLRTGEMRPADPADHITKVTAVAPAPEGAKAPLWEAFLERIFRHDPELVGFMRRVMGYALTGSPREHALIFAWGQGGNGKGVLLNTMSRLLGDYAAVAPADLLLVTSGDRHPTDMAMLRGARLVTAQELAPGRAWDEPKLKSLTGGDPITARFMRQDFFTYEPQFLLAAAGNHKPSFKGVDEAIRRRVNLVPFLQNIPAAERDRDLPGKLMAEGPAILRWAIDGCLEWRRVGLAAPASVRAASDEYLSAEDVLGQWLEERCEISAAVELTATSELYADWREWCAAGNHQPGSSKAFSQRMGERGFHAGRNMICRGFAGISLRSTAEQPSAAHDTYDTSGQIDRIGHAQAHTRTHTSHMPASVIPVMDAANSSPPAWPGWDDDTSWIALLKGTDGFASRNSVILCWGRKAGGTVTTENETVRLMLPRTLPDCPAKFALQHHARKAGLLGDVGGRAP